jgi:hypothetical protein
VSGWWWVIIGILVAGLAVYAFAWWFLGNINAASKFED